MTYLVGKYKLPDHWYPSDLQKRAKVDEYLHWHHLFLRRGAANIIFQKVWGRNSLCMPDPTMQKGLVYKSVEH